ncbi:hypothetical protein [Burkholderia ubonensis]|uniref:hypothetical protein n=1 Tax=Burkholderia ubonensis TaxID=101571 RepID=UPI000A80AA8D|nr:hypothetical protein [Burkholderia ubonensis]
MANDRQHEIDWDALIRAKQAAQKLREVFDRLSPVEKMLARVYIEQVRQLVEHVEAL